MFIKDIPYLFTFKNLIKIKLTTYLFILNKVIFLQLIKNIASRINVFFLYIWMKKYFVMSQWYVLVQVSSVAICDGS